MKNSVNIEVLVAARNEYIEQLKSIVCPLIIQGVNSIYEDALEISQGRETIRKFQLLLKEIPKWNQTILQEESKRIKKKCPYIMDIVTAIFVSNVKILASIRLKGKNENIRVKIPSSDIFIHSIYIESAQQIFYDPFLFYHKTNNFGKVQQNKKSVIEIIRYSVDETIRQMLPFDNILQEYLVNALNDNADNSEENSEASDVSDSDEESIHGDKIAEEFESDSDDEPEEDQPVKNFNMDHNGFMKPVINEDPVEIPLPPAPIQTFDQLNFSNPPPPPPQMQEQPVEQFYDNKHNDSDSDSSSTSSSSSSEKSERRDKHHSHHSHHSNQGQQQDNNKYSFF
jgi:hypothetical protein